METHRKIDEVDTNRLKKCEGLLTLASAFLKLGTTAFGGPAAHLAMMQDEFVCRRKWLSNEEFVDMIGAANLVPGPSSTEVAIHIGYKRAGLLGMVVSGVCFIVPAALMVGALAWGYVRFHTLPGFQSALYGIKPVVVAIVARAILLLIGKVVDTWTKRIALGTAFVLALVGINQLLVLLGSGVALGGSALRREHSWKSALPIATLLASIAMIAAVPLTWEALAGVSPNASPLAVFLYFVKLGSVLYGGGYVLLSFLETDLVLHWSWLTKSQLLDAIAVGQFTPGPVFTTATFIGYLLAGPMGAIAGTVGIFLPAFVFVAISGKLLRNVRGSPVSGSFLDGVNAAALALMASVLVRLGLDAIVDFRSAVIAVVAVILLVRLKVNSALLIAAGALAGMIPMHLRT